MPYILKKTVHEIVEITIVLASKATSQRCWRRFNSVRPITLLVSGYDAVLYQVGIKNRNIEEVVASQQFESQQSEGLFTAFKLSKEVKEIIKANGIDYLAASPLLVLQTGLNSIRETRLIGHQGRVLQVAFSPDGQHLATRGLDGTARLWDLNGRQIAQYEGKNGTISDDWQYIAVTEDTVMTLWPVYTLDRLDELLTSTCEHLGPYLANNPDPRYTDKDRALCGVPPLSQE